MVARGWGRGMRSESDADRVSFGGDGNVLEWTMVTAARL